MENEERITSLAKRVLDLVPYWDRDPDKSEDELVTEIFNSINTQPEDVIEYLLNIIKDWGID